MSVQARISDLQRLLTKFEEEANEDLPIYMISPDGNVYPVLRNTIENYISFVGPVASMNIPRHVALICPHLGTQGLVPKPIPTNRPDLHNDDTFERK